MAEDEAGLLLCRRSDPLDVLSPQMSFIENMQFNVKKVACDDEAIQQASFEREKFPNHTSNFCQQIELCSNEVDEAAKKDASEMMANYLPKAALLGVLENEIAKNKEYNVRLKAYEEATKTKLCPEVALDSDCEKDIRNAYLEVAGTSVAKMSPIPGESIQTFISRSFLVDGPKHKANAAEKKFLKDKCSNKLNLANICKMRDVRLHTISTCELRLGSHDCLNAEQEVLAKLVNQHQTQKSLFYALEQELCLPSRVVTNDQANFLFALDKTASMKMVSATVGGSPAASIINIPSVTSYIPTSNNLDFTYKYSSSGIEGSKDFMGPPTPSKEELEARRNNKPDDSVVIRDDKVLTLDVGNTTQVSDKSNPTGNEVKSFEEVDQTTLSDSFSKSLSDSVVTSRQLANTTTNSEWNSDFSSRFNAITEEEKRKKEEDKKKADAAIAESAAIADKKKQDDTSSALLAQISSLKGKLDEMTQKVDDLKAKKSTDGSTDKDSKELSENEKAIADLKKKLTDLEANKKARDIEDQNALIAQRAKATAAESASRNIASVSPVVTRNESAQTNTREQDNKASNNYSSANNYVDRSNDTTASRAPASVSASVPNGIVLRVAGSQATPESNVVYMTANELQKYPFHLSDTAGSAEIETMLQKSNGSSIIVGESEQIIPIIENGAIALDEQGKIKFKRVKISLVKNDKERKQNIAREISSLGDLRKDEQSQRDLTRYKDMKNALKLNKD